MAANISSVQLPNLSSRNCLFCREILDDGFDSLSFHDRINMIRIQWITCQNQHCISLAKKSMIAYYAFKSIIPLDPVFMYTQVNFQGVDPNILTGRISSFYLQVKNDVADLCVMIIENQPINLVDRARFHRLDELIQTNPQLNFNNLRLLLIF